MGIVIGLEGIGRQVEAVYRKENQNSGLNKTAGLTIQSCVIFCICCL